MANQPVHQKLQCLRSHVVDFLTYQLENDLITEKRAGQLAQAVLDQLPDTITREEIYAVVKKLETDFPEELKNLEATLAACETDEARMAIDQQILNQITQGNIDTALETLGKYKIK